MEINVKTLMSGHVMCSSVYFSFLRRFFTTFQEVSATSRMKTRSVFCHIPSKNNHAKFCYPPAINRGPKKNKVNTYVRCVGKTAILVKNGPKMNRFQA